MLNACFVLPGPDIWASSRLRGIWPAAFMPDTVCVPIGQELPEAQNYIWVKSFMPDFIQESRPHGVKHYLDFCDPTWWWRPCEVRKALDIVDGVIVTCQNMATDFEQQYAYKPHIIKDRMYLPHFDKQRMHRPIQRGQPLRLIWFGASQNRHSLLGAIPALERLCANGAQIALTVMDDKPGDAWNITDMFPISFTQWSLEREVEVIAAHDVAILPPYPGPWGRLKTNNKPLHAWACNVAVSDSLDWGYLWQLATSTEFRAQASTAGRRLVEAEYNAEQSGREWLEVLNGVH